jgi:CheY-like chemotaxis protein
MARILVIDDQTHVRAAIVLALRAQGHDVVDADSGASALREFAHAHFDIAIADVFMPGMDGVRLIRALRERNPKLPVIAMSGVQLAGTGGTALDHLHMARDLAGVVCLKKPFRASDLSQAIDKAMAVAAFIDNPATA